MNTRYTESGKPSGNDYVAGVIIIIGLSVIGGFLFNAPKIWFWIAITLLAGLSTMLRGIYRWRFERSQIHRDHLATRVVKEGLKDFFLYLRPFNSTGRLPITLRTTKLYTHYPGSSSKVYYDRDEIDLETELARALEPCGLLVGLGRLGEGVGAGRISNKDEEWQALVIDLASRANTIFVVPGTSEGTLWELDYLKKDEGLRQKTLLIVPPYTVEPEGGIFKTIGGPREDAVEALRVRGISLQGIETEQGLLMHYSPDAISDSVPLIAYVTPRTQRGLLGWYLSFGYAQAVSKVMTLGLRNAIFGIEPRIATLMRSNPIDTKRTGKS